MDHSEGFPSDIWSPLLMSQNCKLTKDSTPVHLPTCQEGFGGDTEGKKLGNMVMLPDSGSKYWHNVSRILCHILTLP